MMWTGLAQKRSSANLVNVPRKRIVLGGLYRDHGWKARGTGD